jgi:hypothetical protein
VLEEVLELLLQDDQRVLNGVLLVLRRAPELSLRVLAGLATTLRFARHPVGRQRVVACILALGTEYEELWMVSSVQRGRRLLHHDQNVQAYSTRPCRRRLAR